MIRLSDFSQLTCRIQVSPGRIQGREEIDPGPAFWSRFSTSLLILEGRELGVRKSRCTDRQIVLTPKDAEAGAPVAEVCRKCGTSEQGLHLGVALSAAVALLLGVRQERAA
jgi:hypothetical protein